MSPTAEPPNGDLPMSSGQPSRERLFCDAALEYLLSFSAEGVTREVVMRYLDPGQNLRATSINRVYWRLLVSAQNANMRASVVGRSIGGVDALEPVLMGFDPTAVLRKYTDGWEQVLDEIVVQLKPRGQIRRTSRSIWPQFCRSILSGAAFLSQFSDAEEFYAWADVFDGDDRLRPALPLLLSCEVRGLGFPLACDFVKELGYLDFAKPDTHIKKILAGLGLQVPNASDYQTFKTVISFARAAGLGPYYVDKLMWLVGSGFFYSDPQIGSGGYVKTRRDAFVESVRPAFDAKG